ncbi:hypothetical protein GUJ93_ZPchr0010g8465 [Zizania palustris]|uniref:Uncharacterized protein n=1 Tax=Zizania palustris TaxID=103762 RepID=A0A8J5THN8_ZIZPA|nr:hypothetical protein GUJ93_ZPchr0010g8465 [Zizania palustris]
MHFFPSGGQLKQSAQADILFSHGKSFIAGPAGAAHAKPSQHVSRQRAAGSLRQLFDWQLAQRTRKKKKPFD